MCSRPVRGLHHHALPARPAAHGALEQLALSPQCGFASTEEGNVLTEDEQWAKFKLIVDISKEVWK